MKMVVRMLYRMVGGEKKRRRVRREAERHKLAMKKLEYENERLRAENAFLKKLQEFERRRRGTVKYFV
jgi:hypothetical protein